MSTGQVISSRDNPLLKRIRGLVRASAASRHSGEVWVEGEHLVSAAVACAWRPTAVIWTAAGQRQWPQGLALETRHLMVDERLMRELSTLESPATVGALFAVGESAAPIAGQATVVLDRLQDPGNVGSILRTASALGFAQVVAIKGTVALWSAKVVRAAMGAHFQLRLIEGCSTDDLDALALPVLATSSHQGQWLHQASLPWPCAWLFGNEGRGLATQLMSRAELTLRIAQPGGQESLNVAAAAAICLYASASAHISGL